VPLAAVLSSQKLAFETPLVGVMKTYADLLMVAPARATGEPLPDEVETCRRYVVPEAA
jgi:hypothetical protein